MISKNLGYTVLVALGLANALACGGGNARVNPGTSKPSSGSLPTAPTSAVASATSSSAVQLTWTCPANDQSGFKVERSSTSATSGFSQVGTAGAGASTYADGGLAASTTYHYRVRATNAAGDSGYSNVATVATPAGGTTPPPGPPPANVTEALTRLSSRAVFFDHASVGNGVMGGVDRLFSAATGAHPTRLGVGEGAVNPSQVNNGVWADHYFLSGNGNPLQKMAEFKDAELGSSGLGAKLNSLGGVAMMKLCFADFSYGGFRSAADVDAGFQSYKTMMAQLEATYPNIKFVYVTGALHDAAADPDGNVLRERYNDLIRSTYGSTGRVFDLADVESHGEKFQGVRALYSGWSKDGGHLTNAGYDAVATAMVLFVAGLFP